MRGDGKSSSCEMMSLSESSKEEKGRKLGRHSQGPKNIDWDIWLK